MAAGSTSNGGKVQQDEVIMSKLLALKANQDPENGVNKKGIADLHQNTGSSGNLSSERDLICLAANSSVSLLNILYIGKYFYWLCRSYRLCVSRIVGLQFHIPIYISHG